MASMKALSGFANGEVAGILLGGWRGFTPAIRGEVMEALFARKERLSPLLAAIESGDIPAAQIPVAKRTVLLAHADAAIRSRAEKLFSAKSSSRKDVIEKYQPALSLAGDKSRGQKVYEVNCASCHRSGNLGSDVGPNLATIRGWDREKTLLNILDPNREVAPGFVAYSIDLKNGETVGGIIASETATSITLKRAGGLSDTVLRDNVEKISSSGISLMPEGLEAAISPEQMADLLAFVLAP